MRAPTQAIRWVAALVLLAAGAGAAAAQTASEPRLLVLLRDASALAVVDPAEGTVLGQVPTVGNPHEVTATPDGRLAFVASPSEGISVIDLESMTEVRRLDVGAGSVPHDVRFADGKLYFTIEGFKSIARYDPQADEVDWTLGLGQDGAHMMVLGRDRDTIFTANRESDTVSIVEDAAGGPPDWQVTSIPIGGAYPEGLDLSPDGAELWVATRNDGDVSIVDVAAKEVGERLDLNFEDPNRLAFTPDGARVLVSDSATSVVVMDAADRTEITRFDLAPNALLVRPDGAVAYAALRGDDRVAVIDLETLEVVDEFETGAGSGPGCMFWLAPAEDPADSAAALADALTFHASFDNGLDADRADADPALYTAPSYDEQDQAEPGLGNPAVMLAGGADASARAALHRAHSTHLLTGRRGTSAYFPGRLERDRLVLAQPRPRHRPRAGLLRPDPDHRRRLQRRRDLGRLHGREPAAVPAGGVRRPGRVEPGRTRAERQSRLHRSADGGRRAALRGRPLDARGHHLREPRAGGRRRHPYLDGDGCPAGRTTSTSRSPGTSSGAIRLGVNYVGLFDELSLFDRPLTADEVRALHALEGGVAALSTD